MNNVIYNIYSIRTYNNQNLVFYNSTKRKKLTDILSSYKTRYKRYLNHKDNWLNVFLLLEQDKAYIKIEEQLTNSNDELIKSKLCDYIAKNNCINKLNIDEINKLCNKETETEKENQLVLYVKPNDESKEEEIIKTINDIKNENDIKLIEEPKKEIKEEKIKTINELKKDEEIKLIEEPKKNEEIKLTKLYDDDYLYNDENFEPSKDKEIKLIEEPSKDEEKIKTINELKKDEEIKLIEEPSKDEEKIKTINELKKDEEIKLIEEPKINNLKDIKNINSSSYKSKLSSSSVSSVSSSSASSNNDYIRNKKKIKTLKFGNTNKKTKTLKFGNNN
tara:strand:- start:2228 stop:3226 length:999 start_codon:yes stop_codon:yes gene_type:complete